VYAVLFTPFVVVVASLGDYFGIGIASLLLRILFTRRGFLLRSGYKEDYLWDSLRGELSWLK
jgi:hypothetical protein